LYAKRLESIFDTLKQVGTDDSFDLFHFVSSRIKIRI